MRMRCVVRSAACITILLGRPELLTAGEQAPATFGSRSSSDLAKTTPNSPRHLQPNESVEGPAAFVDPGQLQSNDVGADRIGHGDHTYEERVGGGPLDGFSQSLAGEVYDLIVAHLATPEFKAKLAEIVHRRTESHIGQGDVTNGLAKTIAQALSSYVAPLRPAAEAESHIAQSTSATTASSLFPSAHPEEVFRKLGFDEENMNPQTFEMWLAHADLYSSKHTDFDDSKTLKVLLENPISIGKVVRLLVDVAEDGEKALSTKAARLHIALAESQGLAQDVMQLAWLETRHDPTTIFKILSKGDKDFLTKRPKTAIEWLKYNERVNEWSRQQGGIKRSLSKEEIADLLFRGRSFDESMVFIQKFLSAEDPKLMALAHQLREILSQSVSNAHKAKKLKAKKSGE